MELVRFCTTAAIATLGVSLVMPVATPATAAPGSKGAHAAVTDRNFPDPGFSSFGGFSYLYGTGVRFPVARADGPGGDYDVVGNALTAPPAWVLKGEHGEGVNMWAPHVITRPARNEEGQQQARYYLYFSATPKPEPEVDSNLDGKDCIGVATSWRPDGGFVPAAKPLLCASYGFEAIDASIHREGGDDFLIYKTGNYTEGIFRIVAVRLDDTRLRPATGASRRVLIEQSSNIEAPDIQVNPHGGLEMFVSRGAWAYSSYRTEMWHADSLFGEWTHRGTLSLFNRQKSSENRFACGGGGAEVQRFGTKVWIAYHEWSGDGCPPDVDLSDVEPDRHRQAFVGKLDWTEPVAKLR